MVKYCAFLRGVNVNGTSMKMAEVCKIFNDVGMKDVGSVLATGNILFSSDKNRDDLKAILEKELSEYFNYEAFLFLKTEKEIIEIFEQNPFTPADDSHIYVFIGREKMEQEILAEFKNSIKSDTENGEIVNQTFYWQVAKGNTLDSYFGKILGKKSLKEKMTSRNINTIDKIIKKLNA